MSANSSKREKTVKARNRVLKFARKHGAITNQQARRVMGLPQVWYHLHTMEKEGYLVCAEYNVWEPKRRKGRPMAYSGPS